MSIYIDIASFSDIFISILIAVGATALVIAGSMAILTLAFLFTILVLRFPVTAFCAGTIIIFFILKYLG